MTSRTSCSSQRLQHCGRYGVLPLRGQPLVGNRQRGFLLQVAQQPALAAGAVLLLAALPGLALGVCLQLHQGIDDGILQGFDSLLGIALH